MNDFNYYLKTIGEYGEIVQIKGPIVTAIGLPRIKPGEIVLFENNVIGEVFSMSDDLVHILILSKNPIQMHEKIVRTNEFLDVPVGTELLGKIIDPLGNPFGSSPPVSSKEVKRIDSPVLGITARATIKKPLLTGISIVDLLLPLGLGQKQLVIGDRKSGKTSFLLTVVKNQVRQGSIVIYGAIARKQTSIRDIIEYFKKEKISDNIVTVVTTAHDAAGLIYLTPFVAITQAEYFRDQGRDVVVILDDLSVHAKFYREISLIAGRFPGRDSYPGDIFYTHSRLLERAGNFIYQPAVAKNAGDPIGGGPSEGAASKRALAGTSEGQDPHNSQLEVAITVLPVIETIESDLTSYIATNLMAMTDGHIFFDQSTFAKGRRPAINIPLSVTRVGRQAQSSVKREINHKLTAFLSSFEQIENLAHFGAELSGKVQTILKTGNNLYTFFHQTNHTVIPEAVQIVMFALVWSNIIDDSQIQTTKNQLIEAYANNEHVKQLLQEAINVDTFDNLLLSVGEKKDQIMAMVSGTVDETGPIDNNHAKN